VVTALDPLLKTKIAEKGPQTVKSDIRVRGASKNLQQNLLSHHSIMPLADVA
jgi:hypothetical protein